MKVVPKKGMPLLPRTIGTFRREVVALLKVGHGMTSEEALKLVVRFNKYVMRRWKEGKPPCAVADHLSRWAPPRKRGSREWRFYSQRDAQNPEPGEVYESKSGRKWKVKERKNDKIKVEFEGGKEKGSEQIWGRGNLKGMKLVSEEKRQLGLFSGDPSPRRRCKKSTVIQSLVFSKKDFTKAKAKTWAKTHGFRYGKVDETPSSYRIRQMDPKRVKVVGSIKMKKVVAIIGCPNGR